ncbi:MAG: hypothetical protein FJX06_14930 [Alphaproteobacteria bacterium]|nr:hypothetical protein [Alphaproteobacteria bacterium]
MLAMQTFQPGCRNIAGQFLHCVKIVRGSNSPTAIEAPLLKRSPSWAKNGLLEFVCRFLTLK